MRLLLRYALRPTSLGYTVCRIPFALEVRRRFSSKKSSKPLRILFCGSDSFSSASLHALYKEQKADPAGILSIDVLCRPGKRVGRSLKAFRDVPIKGVATELGLAVHERDTFTGWDLPKPDGESINLVIAVSFGLFVPPRILNSAEYGGLNVHPSLLPNFRGAAPLQYQIMHGAEYTGVTLQKLDEKSFDHGSILAQTPSPGIKLDLERKPAFADLLDQITPIGADMLATSIRGRIFVPPFHQLTLPTPPENLIHAPKIKPEDRELNWLEWDATFISRRYRALGPLWNTIVGEDGKRLRIKLDGIEEVKMPSEFKDKRTEEERRGHEGSGCIMRSMLYSYAGGEPLSLKYVEDGKGAIICPSQKSMAIRVSHITVEGQGKKPARLAVDTLRVK